MTDAFGFRAVFSALLPATSAVVERDMAALRPPGVTNQGYRFPFPGLPDSFEGLLEFMCPALKLALSFPGTDGQHMIDQPYHSTGRT